ncbi:MAG TPA: zinc-dependent peptidase [Pirellulales bacterium]|nr:zinc-dependent peptidase [Pirellulales bacterium]
MIFSWLKRRRRRQILAQPFPPEWLRYLEANVVQYRLLTPAEQEKLRRRVSVFVAEKKWIGCGGLVVDDEMKVTIAAQACLLVLGIEYEYHHDQIRSLLVYPDTYLHPPGHDGLHAEERAVGGEAWHRGPIVLSWKNTKAIAGEVGGNLVFHEFAHHLDDLDGGLDGTPPLEYGQLRRWDRVVEEEYHRLVRASRHGRATLLNQYGASNRAEFFAVATECFFERPTALEKRHPELYGILRDFYRQDPARWPWQSVRQHEDSGETEEEPAMTTAEVKGQERNSAGPRTDGAFTEGVWLMNDHRYEEAVDMFDKAIAMAPNDAEALTHRALALVKSGDATRAVEDATAAIKLDERDAAAFRARALAYLAKKQFDDALADCERALAIDGRNGEGYRLRGITRTALGELHRALRDFGAAIHFNADMAEILRARADTYDRLGQFDKARADREKAQRLDVTSAGS